MFTTSGKICRILGASRRLIGSSSTRSRGHGSHVFRGAVARPYLLKHKLEPDTLDNPEWVRNNKADQVAAAVLDWARDLGASSYCHWFQPMAGSLLRHGQAGQVQNCMMEFDKDGEIVWNFKGKHLLKSETDGSSYFNGGLRATHSAAAYVAIDASSPIFIRGDTVFIPAAMLSYTGFALDEKTPLLRALAALSKSGSRLLKLLGHTTSEVRANIGLEQEFFLVDRDLYVQRPDLQLTGRTVIGHSAPRSQELCDHYMGALSGRPLACMQEIQRECFKLGIPLKTRHREVAPNQYEFAPMFGFATSQIDQNITLMQIMEEVASNHGLAVLLHEKPFQGCNGSGKHNNWSLGTAEGLNLLNAEDVAKVTNNNDIFPVVMAAIVSAVDAHGDLMRLSTSCPGNDFRLGACEAPPAIMSVYLGQDLTEYFEQYRSAKQSSDVSVYKPKTRTLDTGVNTLPLIEIPAEDRNRTSPFPYGGHRFEFRQVGSSQNNSFVNTVLATITAKSFETFANMIENEGKSPRDVAKIALEKSFKVVFNGNCYDAANQQAMTAAGLWRFDSAVDAIQRYTAPKNIALFSEMNVLSKEELQARQNVSLSHYVGVVEMEASVLVDIIERSILPAIRANEKLIDSKSTILVDLEASLIVLKQDIHEIHHTAALVTKAELSRKLRLETMLRVREVCDRAEATLPGHAWPLPTYSEMGFLTLALKP